MSGKNRINMWEYPHMQGEISMNSFYTASDGSQKITKINLNQNITLTSSQIVTGKKGYLCIDANNIVYKR